jgi:hypothetical protein
MVDWQRQGIIFIVAACFALFWTGKQVILRAFALSELDKSDDELYELQLNAHSQTKRAHTHTQPGPVGCYESQTQKPVQILFQF